jgi:hypothetical protein
MPNRTFKQYALAFGAQPATVTVKLDNAVIYSGPVNAANEPIPPLPNSSYQVDNVAWTWEANADFQGTQALEITVAGSPLLLARTDANNPYLDPAVFGEFYNVTVDGVQYSDPLTNEAINGQAQAGPYRPDEIGQWWWRIPVGATFTATMNFLAAPQPFVPGAEPPTP